MEDQVQLRAYGKAPQPTLVYLPGLHGDWTLIGGFRRQLRERARFVEFTYPRTLTWSLQDYAGGVEAALRENGMSEGWLLGESFGSQVAWQIVERKQFKVSGIILAGGFVRHPFGNTARVVGKIAGRTSITLRTRLLRRYTQIARFRFRRAPETISDLREFIARRTELDYQAIKHRLDLVADSDPRPVARKTKIPVYALSGFFDPIVPPFPVRSWLRRHCPCLRDYRVVWAADHNVLNCAPRAAAEQVVEWMNDEPS